MTGWIVKLLTIRNEVYCLGGGCMGGGLEGTGGKGVGINKIKKKYIYISRFYYYLFWGWFSHTIIYLR